MLCIACLPITENRTNARCVYEYDCKGACGREAAVWMDGDFLLNTDVCWFHYNNAKVNLINTMCMFMIRGAEGEAAV